MIAHPKPLQRNRGSRADWSAEIPEYFPGGIAGGSGE